MGWDGMSAYRHQIINPIYAWTKVSGWGDRSRCILSFGVWRERKREHREMEREKGELKLMTGTPSSFQEHCVYAERTQTHGPV